MFHLPIKVTIDIKARQSFYKVLNRILYSNNITFKWNITDTCKYTLCSDYDETVELLLHDCDYMESAKNLLCGYDRFIYC